VIYFHTSDEEVASKCETLTILRICGLPQVPENLALDVSFVKDGKSLCNWQ